jgi:hypothetical protein
MDDLTIYLIDKGLLHQTKEHSDAVIELIMDDVLVPDTRLRAIADAWNDSSFMPHRTWIRGKFPRLAAAIDDALTQKEPILGGGEGWVLTQEDNDEPT